MKTSTLLLLGAAAYLYYQYSQQPHVVYGPPAPTIGPPTPVNDPCNGISPVYNADQCTQAGRIPYYPMD